MLIQDLTGNAVYRHLLFIEPNAGLSVNLSGVQGC
jgi:hypothetical protein